MFGKLVVELTEVRWCGMGLVALGEECLRALEYYDAMGVSHLILKKAVLELIVGTASSEDSKLCERWCPQPGFILGREQDELPKTIPYRIISFSRLEVKIRCGS